MSPNLESFLRGLGVAVAVGVLGFIANATNVSTVLGPTFTPIVVALASAALAALDKAHSADGTVLFGSVGRNR